MSLTFTDIPLFVSMEKYEQAIESMLVRLKALPGLVSVYQVGGVSTPGISDIDLFVVFEDGAKVESNPVENLPSTEKYLFTHNLFGTSESFVSEVEQYTCFGKYKLLFGKEQNISTIHLDHQEEKIVKRQVAIEYLVKAWITSSIEHSYHTIKLRNLFLHAKALLIDLSFLGIDSGKLSEAIKDVMQARSRWFEHHLSHEQLNELAQHYHSALQKELHEILVKEKFYLDDHANRKISRNIFLEPSEGFAVSREGISFPRMIVNLHHKVPKVLNRLNKFTFHIPVKKDSIPEVIVKRHRFIESMLNYRQACLPHFIPTAYGLNIFNNTAV